MAIRVEANFAGVNFSGFQHGQDMITVPRPAFLKILQGGKVRVWLAADIEHDGNGANDRYGGDVDPLAIVKDSLTWGRPWLLYLNPVKQRIVYCPHMNLHYEVTGKVA